MPETSTTTTSSTEPAPDNTNSNVEVKASTQEPPTNHFPFSQLEKLLTCPVCLERYKQPKLLPCQHTYCLECLENMADYYKRIVKCAECRTENILPYKGVETFPNNLTIMSFLELPSIIPIEDASAKDEGRIDYAKASQMLIEAAQRQRQQMQSDQSTGISPNNLSSSQTPSQQLQQSQPQQYRFVKLDMCPICNENAELVKCVHCDRKVCPECKESHMEQLQREVLRLLTNTQRNVPKLEETIVIIEQKLANMKNNFNFVKNEIKMEVERCIRELTNRERVLLDEVDNLMESEIRKMTERQATLNTEKDEIENYCQQVSKRLNVPTLATTSSTSRGRLPNLQDQNNNITDEPVDSVRTNESKQNEENVSQADITRRSNNESSDDKEDSPTSSTSPPSSQSSPDKSSPEVETSPVVQETESQQQPVVTDEELLALKTQIATHLEHIRDMNVEAVESYKRMKFIADNNMLRSNILTFGELHVRSVVHSGNSIGSSNSTNPVTSTGASSNRYGSSNLNLSPRRSSSSYLRSLPSFDNEAAADDDLDAIGTTSSSNVYNYKTPPLSSTSYVGGSRYATSTGSTLSAGTTASRYGRYGSSKTTGAPYSSTSDYLSTTRSRPNTSTFSNYIGSSAKGSSTGTGYDDNISSYLGNESSSPLASSGHKNWRSDIYGTGSNKGATPLTPLIHTTKNDGEVPGGSKITWDKQGNLNYRDRGSKLMTEDYDDSLVLPRTNIYKLEGEGGRKVREAHKSFYLKKYGRSLTNTPLNEFRDSYSCYTPLNQNLNNEIIHQEYTDNFNNKHGTRVEQSPETNDFSILRPDIDDKVNQNQLSEAPKIRGHLDRQPEIYENSTTYITNVRDEPSSVHKKKFHKGQYTRSHTENALDLDTADIGVNEGNTIKRNSYQIKTGISSKNTSPRDNDISNDKWWKAWLIDDGEIKTRAEKRLEKYKQVGSFTDRKSNRPSTSSLMERPQSSAAFIESESRNGYGRNNKINRACSSTRNSNQDLFCASSSSSVEYLHNPPIKERMEQKQKNMQETSDHPGSNFAVPFKSANSSDLSEFEKSFTKNSLKNKFNTLQRFKRRNELLMSLAASAVFSPDGTSNVKERYIPIRERIQKLRAISIDKRAKEKLHGAPLNEMTYPGNLNASENDNLLTFDIINFDIPPPPPFDNAQDTSVNGLINNDYNISTSSKSNKQSNCFGFEDENYANKSTGIQSVGHILNSQNVSEDCDKASLKVAHDSKKAEQKDRKDKVIIMDEEVIFENEIRAYIARITKLQKDIDQFTDDIESEQSLKDYDNANDRRPSSSFNLSPNNPYFSNENGIQNNDDNNKLSSTEEYVNNTSLSSSSLSSNYDNSNKKSGKTVFSTEDESSNSVTAINQSPDDSLVMETITSIGATTDEQDELEAESPVHLSNFDQKTSINSSIHSVLIKHESLSKPMNSMANNRKPAEKKMPVGQLTTNGTSSNKINHPSSRPPKAQTIKNSRSLLSTIKDKFLRSENGKNGTNVKPEFHKNKTQVSRYNKSANEESHELEAVLKVKILNPKNSATALEKHLYQSNTLNIKRPTGMCLSTDGQILFVADKGAHKIWALKLHLASPEKGYKIQPKKVVSVANVLKTYGSFGTSPEKLNRPCDLALDPFGNQISVVDSANNRIICLDASLNFLRILTNHNTNKCDGGTLFNCPSGVSYDGTGDYLYVSDRGNRRIQIYNLNIAQSSDQLFGSLTANSYNFVSPKRVYFSSRRNLLYVTDVGDHSVKIIDPRISHDKKSMIAHVSKIPVYSKHGSPSTIPERFNHPSSVNCYRYDSENVALLDAGNRRIIQLTPEGRVIQIIPLISTANETSFPNAFKDGSSSSPYASSFDEDVVEMYSKNGYNTSTTSNPSIAAKTKQHKPKKVNSNSGRAMPKFDTCISLSLLDDFHFEGQRLTKANGQTCGADHFQMFALTDTANNEITFI